MTIGMGMEMSQEPEMEQDAVADAILLPHDDPERLMAIIRANQQQRQMFLDLIRESQERFLGFFEEHMQKIMAYQEDQFEHIHVEHRAITANLERQYDATVSYVQQLATVADVALRELALDHDARLTSLEHSVVRIEKHLNLDPL